MRKLAFSFVLLVAMFLVHPSPASNLTVFVWHDDLTNQTHEVGFPLLAEGPSDSGHENNGHGNNLDGVDSSNPSKGRGGPNGRVDPSCSGDSCVDDEKR